MTAHRTALALGALLWAAAPAGARVVEVPMHLEHSTVRQLLVAQVFDQPGESTPPWRDAAGCNEIVLSQPALSGEAGRLRVRAHFRAQLGAGFGGYCFTTTPRSGLVDVLLEPQLHPSLPVVEFRVVGSELLDPDGVERISGQLWSWVRSLVHPHLETLRIDLGRPIAEIEAFVPLVLPGADAALPPPLESIGLGEVTVDAGGVAVLLRISLAGRGPVDATPGAPEPALGPEELARWQRAWQSWDAFLTWVIKASSRDADEVLRAELREVLLEARYEIDALLGSEPPPGPDPLRPLFLSTWTRLAPLLRRLATDLPGDSALRFLTFITAADALAALEQLGPDAGIELTTDGLRRMARMIEPAPEVDPTAYGDALDPELRELFGFGPPLESGDPDPPPEVEPPAPAPAPPRSQPGPRQRGPAAAFAPAAAERQGLDGWIPRPDELLEYLAQVRQLLASAALGTQRVKDLPARHAPLFRNLVLATAWQESCWRQIVRRKGSVEPLTSGVGAVGIMQVHQHVWRGFYDVESLRSSIRYNAWAGSEILQHYLVDYAIRKGEEQARGEPGDLARAAYAAYNAGPSQLRRYRLAGGGKGHRIDQAFWHKYQTIHGGDELAVAGCFPGHAASLGVPARAEPGPPRFARVPALRAIGGRSPPARTARLRRASAARACGACA